MNSFRQLGNFICLINWKEIHNLCIRAHLSTMDKRNIFITRSDYPDVGIELLKNRYNVELWPSDKGPITQEEFIKRAKGKAGIYCSLSDKVDKKLLESAGEQLKVIATMSVGVDHVDLSEMKKRGVKLGYTPDVLTEATAELTVALLLATSRRLLEANKQILESGWTSWSPLWMCGQALNRSTVGVVGYGRIGQSVARKLNAFNVAKILYTSRTEKCCPLGGVKTELETLLRESDFVIATCALTEETKMMFNKERIGLMKPSAIFINSSRGGVVDQDALLCALQNGCLYAAGLDVMTPEPLPPDHPLLQLSNCVILPHIGSATYQARFAMSELTANNIICALEGQPMPSEYPLP